MATQANGNVRVFSLGGIGEIGKNMYVIESEQDMIVIDAGLMFPEDDMLGIDIVIPDISYLTQNKEKLRGIFLTHGHEDHIGALTYILRQVHVPVYGTKLTLGIVESYVKEKGLRKKPDFRVVHDNSVIQTGQLKTSFFRTNHSIPDSVGMVVQTPEGIVVHTGDFKFDQTPVDGQYTSLDKLTEIGKKGVLCLLSDSINAEVPGVSPSEAIAGNGIMDIFLENEGRIVITTFATNIHRIQQVIQAAEESGRKIAVNGQAMEKTIEISRRLGYLEVEDDIFITTDQVEDMDPRKVAILCTGSQGEPVSALMNMAKGEDDNLTIEEGDMVIIAANPVAGNEKTVSQTIDFLYQIGAEVVMGENVHSSGHARQEELKMMLNLVKPKYFIPVHGEYRMQFVHGELAEETGMDPNNIFLLDKGEVVEFSKGKAVKAGKVPAGNVLIDGLGIGDVGNIVLRDRRLLSEDGILVVVVTLSKKTGTIASGPDIISRGFVYVRESEELMEKAHKKVTETLEKSISDNVSEWSTLKSSIRDSMSRFLYEKTKRRPMILPIIMEI
ncbi:ribonuclease J [Marinococcus halophilus]|uniref:Ribonuclease J n=1 Tax=Marinococcus halophilus TaxID=1371 RepID=A0A510Y296_MARHA|nr:ribonuclease J [Marinococcus halophilus]OZT81484.1 ribonuclease J [Marinococcus halophilus]GEK57445.1 ribonuclease J [Marinococcus halophilus]